MKKNKSANTGAESEQVLLGACLLNPGAFSRIAQICTADSFAVPAHVRIFQAIDQVWARGDTVDLISVCDALGDVNAADYGVESWESYLGGLCQAVPAARNADQYARLVRRNAENRGREHERLDEVPPKYSHDRVADRFSCDHAEGLVHVAVNNAWWRYTAGRWTQEQTLLVFDRSRQVARALSVEALTDPDLKPDQRAKTATYLSSVQTFVATERIARADRRHAREADQWDRHLTLLNCPEGVLDLRSGEVGAHDPRLHLTKMAGATPGGACPLWDAFLQRITGGDAHVITYLQRFVGSCLSGVLPDHMFLFLFGPGANGKSTFLNVVLRLFGDYAVAAPMEMFVDSGIERHPTELARLEGARLVVSSEIEEGRRFKLALLKQLTGGDPITARLMRRDFFTFQPQCKLILAGNHRPNLRHVDEALRRRLCLVPFTQTIPPEERDTDLPAKLWAEAGGILRWALDGCLAWQERGLQVPAAVRVATDNYFETEDIFAQWLHDQVELDPNAFTPVLELRNAYQGWAESMGEKFLGVKRFSQALEDHGFVRASRSHNSVRGFEGLRLKLQQHRLDAVA